MKKYLFRPKGLLLIVLLFILASSIVNVGLAFIAKIIIDLVYAKEANTFIVTVSGAFVFMLIMAVVNYLLGVSKAKYLTNLMIDLKADVFNRISNLSITKFTDQNSATYISILLNDLNVLEESYFHPVLLIVSDILVFSISVIALFRLNQSLAVVTIITGIIPFLIPKLTNKRLSLLRQEYSTNVGRFTTRIKDIFTGFEVMKSFNMSKQIFAEYHKDNIIVEQTRFKTSVFEGVIEALSIFAGFSMYCITLTFGVYLALNNKITMGTIIAATQLTNNVINPIVRIGYRMTAIKSTKPIIEKIKDIGVPVTETQQHIDKKDFTDRIEFTNISFCYDGKSYALHNLNLQIEKGKKYAIVGHSGSGKSTLLKLILNYYTEYSGEIRMDGIAISEIKSESLYKLVSMIHQNVFLFDTTLKENIALYQPYDDDQIQQAIQRSGLSSFGNTLGAQVDTRIGEAGSKLSGGERQRIAIARALVRNTPILLLDEATSSLDHTLAYNIEKSILDLQEITAMVITHKLSPELLMQYDSILVMRNGELVDQGSFESLMERKQYFYSLYLVEENDTEWNEKEASSAAS